MGVSHQLPAQWLLIGVAFIALIGFVLRANNKVLTQHYDNYVVILLMQVIAFATMLIIVGFKPGYKKVLRETSSLTLKHIALLIFGGLGGLALFIVGMRLLETHGIGHLSILDTAFDALIAVLGGYLVFSEKVTLLKVTGILSILGGVYLTSL